MKKIPCLFEREFHGRDSFTLLQTVTPGCEWVLAGEGIPTRKRDGTACLVQDGKLYKRYDAKNGKRPPEGAIPCDPEPDPTTGHWPHWVLVRPDDPASKWHWAAWCEVQGAQIAYEVSEDGTYELCGPHFSPAEGLHRDQFFRHGAEVLNHQALYPANRSWVSIGYFLQVHMLEGIVFHHPDWRMAKIRRDDYGLWWKPGRR